MSSFLENVDGHSSNSNIHRDAAFVTNSTSLAIWALVQSKKNQNHAYWSFASHFSYNAAGAVTSMQLGNGRWESTQFNSRLQPTQIALGKIQNATDLLKLDYQYGDLQWNGSVDAQKNNGNLAKQTITVQAVGATPGFTAVLNYDYDSLNRIQIASETLTPTSGTPESWVQEFKYDRYGNRKFNEQTTTTLPRECGTAPNFTVCPDDPKINPSADPNNNKLIGYTFDAAGNTTRDAENRKFTYDSENKQVKVETLSGETVTGTVGEYWYDGDGKRIKKRGYNNYVLTEETIFVYDAGGQLIGEYSNQVATSQDAKVAYLTSDHLGSPRINTDINGNVTARHDYHPFGEEVASSKREAALGYADDTVRQQFTGYERDTESGLDFAQARYFRSNSGRFSSPDPWPGVRYLPQSLNRYAYVSNNPLNFTDPHGFCGTAAGSPDKTPCIWLKNSDGRLMSVSQQQYDNRTGDEYAGFTPLTDAERQIWSGSLTNLEGTYAEDEEYQGFVRNGTTLGLGENGRFVEIRDPVMVIGPEEDVPSFFSPQDVSSHGWFFLRMGVSPIYGVGDLTKNLVTAPILQQMADTQDWGPNDPGSQRKHCWVNCVATGLNLGDSSSIAVLGTTQELLTTYTFWRSPEQRAVWVDSKRDMAANRRGQNLFYNFYMGRCKEACISQTP